MEHNYTETFTRSHIYTQHTQTHTHTHTHATHIHTHAHTQTERSTLHNTLACLVRKSENSERQEQICMTSSASPSSLI